MKCLKSFYVNGTPLHAVNDQSAQSAIFIIPESMLATRSVQESQLILSRQHLLVTRMAVEPMQFDELGLETIKLMDTVIDIFGED